MSNHESNPSDGEVSEVSRLDPEDADTPISDSQATAGNPDSPDSDQLGEAGPDASPRRARSEGQDRA